MGPLAAGISPGSRANGSFPMGARRLSEKSPANPPPHQPSPGGSASATPPHGGSDCPGSRGASRHRIRKHVPLAGPELTMDDAVYCRLATKKGLCRESAGPSATGIPWRREDPVAIPKTGRSAIETKLCPELWCQEGGIDFVPWNRTRSQLIARPRSSCDHRCTDASGTFPRIWSRTLRHRAGAAWG